MNSDGSVVVFSVVRGCLVATPLRDLDAEGRRGLHTQLSLRLKDERVKGVILDVSTIEVMDESDFAWVRDTLRLAELMGRRGVLAALAPEVAATLVRLGANVNGIEAARTVDRAVDLLLGEGP